MLYNIDINIYVCTISFPHENEKHCLRPVPNRNKNSKWNISGSGPKCPTLLFCTPALGGDVCTAKVEKWQNCVFVMQP